jgi:beta-lactam-binding protein with PASTA domain
VLALIGVLALVGVVVGISMLTPARQVEVPNVVGKQSVAAAQQITKADLVPASVRSTSDQPCGIVIAIKPKAHDRVDPHTKIYMTVSTGPRPVAQPRNAHQNPACPKDQAGR